MKTKAGIVSLRVSMTKVMRLVRYCGGRNDFLRFIPSFLKSFLFVDRFSQDCRRGGSDSSKEKLLFPSMEKLCLLNCLWRSVFRFFVSEVQISDKNPFRFWEVLSSDTKTKVLRFLLEVVISDTTKLSFLCQRLHWTSLTKPKLFGFVSFHSAS